MIRDLITRSRLDCSAGQLGDTELEMMIDSWSGILQGLPTSQLHEAYTLAMREHCRQANPGPFKAGSIFAAWEKAQLTRGQREHFRLLPRTGEEMTLQEALEAGDPELEILRGLPDYLKAKDAKM